MLSMTYVPDKDIKQFECVDSVEMYVDDGKTVSEMLNAFVRMMLTMGFNQDSLQGHVNTNEYPYIEE